MRSAPRIYTQQLSKHSTITCEPFHSWIGDFLKWIVQFCCLYVGGWVVINHHWAHSRFTQHTHTQLHFKHTHITYRPQQMPPLSHRQETPSTSSIRLPVSMYLTLLTMKSHSSKPAFRIFYIYIGRKLQKQFVDHVTCASFVVEYCGNRLRFLPKTSSFATKSQTKSSTESHQFPDM